MNSNPRRSAACHPDRPHRSLGLCSRCYGRERYRRLSLTPGFREHRNQANAKKREARSAASPLISKECPFCGRTFKVRQGNTVKRFCSIKCGLRATHVRLKYGLSPSDFRSLTKTGRCFICQRRIKKWHVDHDHKTLETWGVICSRCNTHAVAGVARDADTARRLVEYIENPPARQLDGQLRMADPSRINTQRRRRRSIQ